MALESDETVNNLLHHQRKIFILHYLPLNFPTHQAQGGVGRALGTCTAEMAG